MGLFGFSVEANSLAAAQALSRTIYHDPSGRSHAVFGNLLHDSGNVDEALPVLRDGAALGSASCMCILALSLSHADDSEEPNPYEDEREGLRLFIASHKLGNPDATANLAFFLDVGDFTPQNLPLAYCLLESASSRGLIEAEEAAAAFLKDPARLIPYSRWEPKAYIHRWVSASMHQQIQCLLLCHLRDESPISLLPRELLLLIFFLLVCRPNFEVLHSAEQSAKKRKLQ